MAPQEKYRPLPIACDRRNVEPMQPAIRRMIARRRFAAHCIKGWTPMLTRVKMIAAAFAMTGFLAGAVAPAFAPAAQAASQTQSAKPAKKAEKKKAAAPAKKKTGEKKATAKPAAKKAKKA
ncbi:MAG: hypothetical protein CTR53_00345 [Ferrovibrio sp.]|nr:MAG: hypothetical protein CTR53_00345 [Ferrovibrio sp.]